MNRRFLKLRISSLVLEIISTPSISVSYTPSESSFAFTYHHSAFSAGLSFVHVLKKKIVLFIHPLLLSVVLFSPVLHMLYRLHGLFEMI